MFNSERQLKKNEEEEYDFLNNKLPYLTTNLPFSLSLENNLEKNSIINSELDSKELLSFLYEKDYFNNNFLPSYEIPPMKFINLKSKEEKIKDKNNEINNIPGKEIKFIEIQKNNYNNDNVKFIISKQNNTIFNIEKTKKKGRIKKYSNKIGKHNKFEPDNIIRRFKVQFTQNIYNYLNKSFIINKNKKQEKIVKVIKKISPKITKSIKKKDNIIWLNSTIKDLFSNFVSKRFYTYDNKYNEKMIKKIYKKRKEKDAIEILDKTVKDFWLVYINDDIENKYIGFNTIKDDINKLLEKGETEEYINKYIKEANQFEHTFINMKPREKKK